MSTFEKFGFAPLLLKALDEIGFEKPTLIQSKAIPFLMESDDDLVALAQTGTGKTAAFSLPLVSRLKEGAHVQVLVLCPTRELAIQIANDVQLFGKYLPSVSVEAVYGGERIDKQIRALKKGVKIVVGTPGRVNDLIKRRVLKLGSLEKLVLDEADEMLNMGFKEELDEILVSTPEQKQVLLFSATMNKSVRRIADSYMNNPRDITVGELNSGSDNVTHYYYMVNDRHRYEALRRIADFNPDIHGIVFCRTKRQTQEVADKLIQDQYSAEAIHGDVSQEQRSQVMERFRDKKVQILVATDVAARGIDVEGLTHIINYNLPDRMESYVHRSGRTGRAHNDGISLVLVNRREQNKIKFLEKKIGQSFKEEKIPNAKDICQKQLMRMIDDICKIDVNAEQIDDYFDVVKEKLADMDRDELLKKIFLMEFRKFLDRYRSAPDLNQFADKKKKDHYEKSGMKFSKIRLNVGKYKGLGIKELFEFFNSQRFLKGVEIGQIDIGKDSTLFEVDDRFQDAVLQAFGQMEVAGEAVEAFCEGSRASHSGNTGRNFKTGRGAFAKKKFKSPNKRKRY